MTYKTNLTSYKGAEYHKPSASYKSGLPPPPKPYDLKGAINALDYNPRNKEIYSFSRPQLTYERPTLSFARGDSYFDRPELSLRTIHTSYQQSLRAA